jgi:hypothetical protein
MTDEERMERSPEVPRAAVSFLTACSRSESQISALSYRRHNHCATEAVSQAKMWLLYNNLEFFLVQLGHTLTIDR